jgi:hypothetical protein
MRSRVAQRFRARVAKQFTSPWVLGGFLEERPLSEVKRKNYLHNNISILLARPAGLEPAASRLEVSRSIQMSYGRAPDCALGEAR